MRINAEKRKIYLTNEDAEDIINRGEDLIQSLKEFFKEFQLDPYEYTTFECDRQLVKALLNHKLRVLKNEQLRIGTIVKCLDWNETATIERYRSGDTYIGGFNSREDERHVDGEYVILVEHPSEY